jgi:hypothetical protein
MDMQPRRDSLAGLGQGQAVRTAVHLISLHQAAGDQAAGVTPDMRRFREASLGPVVEVVRARDEAQAIDLATDPDYACRLRSSPATSPAA